MDVITFYLIALVLIGAMLFPTVRKFMGGAQTADAARRWSQRHGFTVDQSAQSPTFPFVDYDGRFSAQGTLEGHSLTIGVGLGGFASRPVPMTFVQTTLPHPVPGQALVRTTDALWLGPMQHVKLESTKFRDFLMVFAQPRNLATALMSTDFMDWYERQHQRPVIYVSQRTCCLVFQRYVSAVELEAFAAMVPTIIQFITKSGALERPITDAQS